jgi:imidazolonepropionase-like amidohydrolase
MKNIQLVLVVWLICFGGLSAQQVNKASKQNFALTNAEIHTITNGVITGSLLVIDGEIAGVGEIEIPDGIQLIDCEGQRVYPGMIDAGTTVGLSEIGSISLTQDANEIGDVTPHMQALTAINPNSVVIPVTRVNGVTTVISKPTGGLFPGTSALINLNGYTPQQMYAGYKALVMNWPSSGRRGRWDRRTDEEIEKRSKAAMENLQQLWDKADQYAVLKYDKKAKDLKYNPELDAIAMVLRKEMDLHVEANKDKDILKALEWLKEKDIHVVLTGVKEGWRVKDSLAKAGYPVITGPILSVPSRASDSYEVAYSNAGIMAKAGVMVAIRTNESENARNLPYHAGFAANYGMGTKEAMKAVTINPARMLKVDDKYGSIEKGKRANLFVCNGDPFETKTRISHLFIEGWNVPLESRHTLLNDEFLDRDATN